MENYFLIGDVSKLIDIPKSTLRYYDEKGIISPIIKGENGYRYYSGEQLIILKEIKIMRNMDISLGEIKRVLENSKDDEMLEVLDRVLIRIRQEMLELQNIERNILEDIRVYHKNNKKEIGVPFIEIILEDRKGVELFNLDDKKNMTMVMKKLENIEKNNEKIKGSIIKTTIKDLEFEEGNEVGYVVLRDEKQNNKIVVSKGKYVSIYGKGQFREQNSCELLMEYIRKNNLKIQNEDVYISFQISTLSWRKEEIIFKMRILLKD